MLRVILQLPQTLVMVAQVLAAIMLAAQEVLVLSLLQSQRSTTQEQLQAHQP
jgi:hypothetical protein